MMNSVSIIGRWARDAELRFTPTGKGVASGTLAVQRSFKNQNGDYDADFIQVVIWGDKVAEMVANNGQKGNRFGGTGRLNTRRYEANDGRTVFVTEVIIENVTMIDWANSNNQGGQSQNQGNRSQNQGSNNYTRVDEDPFQSDGKPIDISDDDLPF